MKKIASIIVVVILCISMLVSCASDNKAQAMSITDGGEISINFLYLLTSIQKSMYSDMIDSYGGNWNMVVNSETGETFSDVLYNVVIQSAENFLVCEYMHDNVYSLELSEEQLQSIESQVQSMIQSVGSKGKLEELLSRYSADIKTLERYFELCAKQANIYSVFYSEGGIHEMSEEAIMKHFEENYSIVTHIYFNTLSKTKPDGTLVSLTEEEKAEKTVTAQSVYESILAGKDFYELKEQYSEDAYEGKYYPKGIFVTYDTAFPTDFTMAALDMETLEYRLVDSSESGIHIMHKLPMDKSLYNSNSTVYQTIRELLCTEDFNTRISQYSEMVNHVSEQVSALNVAVVPEFNY